MIMSNTCNQHYGDDHLFERIKSENEQSTRFPSFSFLLSWNSDLLFDEVDNDFFCESGSGIPRRAYRAEP